MAGKQDHTTNQSHANKPYLDRADLLIVGNGIAGLTAAIEARRLAPDKRIVIMTDQIHPTINTPSLKQFAVNKLTREQLLAYPAGTERIERIHVVNAHVEAIHAQNKYVSLNGGRAFGYDAFLIATGSRPVQLPEHIQGRDFDGVLTLHRLQDYLDFRRRIGEVADAVVVGGGPHAIETVTCLLHWGIHVHWLVRGETLMSNVFDQAASDLMLNGFRRSGVTIHLKTEVAGIVGRVGAVAGVITNRQQMIPCQLVLTCTGTQPAMSLAEHCSVPMQQKRGILVDNKLRTSVRDIYAAGDVAALPNPLTGTYEPRPLWYAAVAQGRVAGAMMVGHDARAQQPFGVQWHATQLGDLYVLAVGDPLRQGDGVTFLVDSSQGGYRRLAIKDNRLIGYLSLGTAQPDSLAIKRIVDEGLPVHDLTRALLKGHVAVREYLSQLGSRTAQRMLTSKLPGPNPAVTRPLTRSLPDTGELASVVDSKLKLTKFAQDVAPQRPASAVNASRHSPAEEQAASMEEDVSPFTGNLPLMNIPTGRNVGKQQIDGPSAADDLSPFAGNLPHLPVVGDVETTTDR